MKRKIDRYKKNVLKNVFIIDFMTKTCELGVVFVILAY
jgi:hypothetical protein